LKSNDRLADRFAVVNENWDLLVNRVRLKQQRALVPQVLVLVLVLDAFLGQSDPQPHPKWARPEVQQDNLVCH
ncbi:hypothetical protein T07_12648, partial [Trichinella nelsoni]